MAEGPIGASDRPSTRFAAPLSHVPLPAHSLGELAFQMNELLEERDAVKHLLPG